MKKTMQHILGVTVALAMTASGAFADPVLITELPINIDQPGDYQLALPADAPPLPANFGFAIYITSSNVNLDLNDQTLDCQQGVYISNVDHVSVKNGTFNGVQSGGPCMGLWLDSSSYVSVLNVNFNGSFAYNADYGSHNSLKNCNFESPLSINVNSVGHGTYENLVVAKNQYSDNGGLGTAGLALYSSGKSNSFKNIRVLSGNVVLGSSLDTYQHFFLQSPSTLQGGTNVQPRKP